jgi:hypothetical protein
VILLGIHNLGYIRARVAVNTLLTLVIRSNPEEFWGSAGNRTEARALLAQLAEIGRTRHVPATAVGMIHAGLGEKDKAPRLPGARLRRSRAHAASAWRVKSSRNLANSLLHYETAFLACPRRHRSVANIFFESLKGLHFHEPA